MNDFACISILALNANLVMSRTVPSYILLQMICVERKPILWGLWPGKTPTGLLIKKLARTLKF